MNKIISFLSLSAIYIYILNILSQWGYDSYFGIPSYFISYSIKENTIFSYYIAQQILDFVLSIKFWWLWIVLILIAVFFIKKLWIFLLGLLVIVSLWYAIDLGRLSAQHRYDFPTLSSECSRIGVDSKYIIPVIHDNIALLVPIDENKKMKEGFIAKNITDLNCKIIYNWNIGPITQ